MGLIAAWVPHLSPSAWIYYSSPSKDFTIDGVEFSSEEGAQQGDHVGNHAFSMVAKVIDDRLQDLKFALKLFYVDDLLLIADLETLVKALKTIKELKHLTGIEVNLKKTVLSCPKRHCMKRQNDCWEQISPYNVQ